MADHWYTQVREALKLKLTATSLATVPPRNVFTEDEYPRAAGKFPGLNIVIGDCARERKGTVNGGNGVQLIEVENRAVVEIEIVGQQVEGLRALLLQIAKEVEARWLATATSKHLGVQGLRDVELVGLRRPEFDREGEIPVASQVMQFEITVRSFEGRADQT